MEGLNGLQILYPGRVFQISHGNELRTLSVFAHLAIGISAITVLHQERFDLLSHAQPGRTGGKSAQGEQSHSQGDDQGTLH